MPNEEITIKVGKSSVVTELCRRGKLWYQAPGLDIYVSGAVPAALLHIVHYQAVAEALSRHIPAASVRHVQDCGCRQKKINPAQKRLPGTE